MSGPIQALAPGYLGLLGLKNMGRLPDVQVDQLQPIIDILPFYLHGRRQFAQYAETGITTVDGGLRPFPLSVGLGPTVPENTLRIILRGTFWVSVAAASVFSLAASLAAGSFGDGNADRILSPKAQLGTPFAPAVAPVVTSYDAVVIDQLPIFLYPGDFLAAWLDYGHGAGAGETHAKVEFVDIPL